MVVIAAAGRTQFAGRGDSGTFPVLDMVLARKQHKWARLIYRMFGEFERETLSPEWI